METKRLFIGGLFAGITEIELKDRLGRFGDVSNVELKTRKSDEGEPIKTFAHCNLQSTPDKLKKCMATYNGSKWKGSTLSIQIAKENFLDRLQKERVALDQKKLDSASPRETKKPKDIQVPGSKPGDPVPGEENWVVGKHGRALPVVHMRRKDGKKVMTVDPSKYCHSLKVMKDAQEKSTSTDQLTWQMEENDSEMTKKKMGVFPAMKKKKKKPLASSVDPEYVRKVEEAEQSRLESFEVVSHRKVKTFVPVTKDDTDSDDTDEIIAMKRPRLDNTADDSSSSSEADMETSGVNENGVLAGRSKKDQRYNERVAAVWRETDELILTPEPSLSEQSRNDGISWESNRSFTNNIVQNAGENSDSDASTDIDDILTRIQKKPKTPKQKVKPSDSKAKEAESVSSDEEMDSVVQSKKRKREGVGSGEGSKTPQAGVENDAKKAKKKRKSAKKKEKTSKPVQKESVDSDDSDEELDKAEKFCEPTQGNESWTKPVKKLKISAKDVVSFDDDGRIVEKHYESDDDSAGSADTDELFTRMKNPNVSVSKSSPGTFSTPTAVPSVPSSGAMKSGSKNVSFLDEFASGLDDFATGPSKQSSDSNDSDSDSDSDGGETMVVLGSRAPKLAEKQTDLKVKSLDVSKSKVMTPGVGSKKKKPVTGGASSDSDDEFFSCESDSSDSDSGEEELSDSDSKIPSKSSTSEVEETQVSNQEEDDSSDEESDEDSSDSDPKIRTGPKRNASDSESDDVEASDSSDSDSKEPPAKGSVSKTHHPKSDSSDSDSEESDEDIGNSDSEDVELKSDSDSTPVIKLTEADTKVDSGDSEPESSEERDSSDSDSKMRTGQKCDSSDSDSDDSEESDSSDLDSPSSSKPETPKISSRSASSGDASENQSKDKKDVKSIKADVDSTSVKAGDKQPSAQSKKEKKKDKDKSVKNVSKIEKHKTDNEKRMEGFQQRRQESQSKRTAIREALAAVDSGKTKSKRIVFSSDSECDDTVEDDIKQTAEIKKPVPQPKERSGESEKAKGLFDSDSEEEMEEGVDDEEMFRIRPQYEGKAGQKLLKLQRRYGDDERFKMDEKFLDSGSDDETMKKMPSQPDGERSERDRQMDVLKDMFGSRAVADKGQKKAKFQNASSVHFDPTREDHSQFEVQAEPKKAEKKKKRKLEEEKKAEDAELPEVSKERFYEVASDLKGVFQASEETPTFSFLTGTADMDVDGEDEKGAPKPEVCKPTDLLPWQAETFNYDTSSGSEEEDERVNARKQSDTDPKKDNANTKLFFFTFDDKRIKEGVESFQRIEDMSVIRKEWWEKRPALIEGYKLRRKRALRKQKLEHVAQHKRAKGKWK